MLPLPDGRIAARVDVAGEAVPERQVVARREMVDPEHRPGPGPAADDPDVVLRRRLLHPRLEREACVVERAESGQPDVVVRAVERQRAAEAPRSPRRTDDRAVLAGAGRVHGRRPGALVERVRGDESRRRRVRQSRGGQRHGEYRNSDPQHQPHRLLTLPFPAPRRSRRRHHPVRSLSARASVVTTLRRPGSTYPTGEERVTRRWPGTWRSRR